jgi:hypothetical protein
LGNSTPVQLLNGNGDDLLLKRDDPEKMATIKPQQPYVLSVVYPAMRKTEPGYRQVYTWKSARMWKIPAFRARAPYFSGIKIR